MMSAFREGCARQAADPDHNSMWPIAKRLLALLIAIFGQSVFPLRHRANSRRTDTPLATLRPALFSRLCMAAYAARKAPGQIGSRSGIEEASTPMQDAWE